MCVLVLVTALLCFNAALAQDFVSMVRDCRQNHLDRNNECLVNAIHKMRPRLPDGIPELELPSMDPYKLEPIDFIQETGPVNVRAKYTNLVSTGLSKFDIKYFDWHFQDQILYLGCVVPTVTLTGHYNITGRIFELPIVGEGPYESIIKGLVLNSKSNLGQNQQGKVYVKDTKLDFTITESFGKMENLFDGNPVLSQTMEHFLRENNDVIIEEVRPELSRQLGNILGTIIKSIMKAMPADSVSNLKNDNANDKHRRRTIAIKAKQGNNRDNNRSNRRG